MKAAETNLQSILEGTKQYVVPLFQRPYNWESKQWQKLWDDLLELSESDNPRDHFIGSIVTMPTTSVPEGAAKYLLIDGQQRLTTILILLAVLRDKLAENEEKEELTNTLMVNQYKKGSDHYKLLPTQGDREVFQNIIDGDISSLNANHSNVAQAYSFFERKLRRNNVDLEILTTTISHHLVIVSIVLDSDDNPYLVFESLNGTGLPLSQADLIRNYFFMQIHTDSHEKLYGIFWKPMQELLGDSLTEFIRHYLMKNGVSVNKNDVYFTLKERVSHRNALEELSDLSAFSKYYGKLIDPDNEVEPRVRNGLVRLKRLESTTVYPFLLNCYGDYSNGRLSQSQFLEVLAVIENFLVRRFVCNVPTDRLKSIFPPLHGQISQKYSNFVEGLKSVLQSKDYPNDVAFRTSLQESKLYGSRDRVKKTRFILEALEESFNHKEPVSLDGNTVSIEHIMPQTLTEEWQAHLGDEWALTHELWLHTLGNLTLTGYNAELSNDPYEVKRDRLIGSHFELNRYFQHKDSWTKEDIQERAAYLAGIAIGIWKYFGDESATYMSDTNVTGKSPQSLMILGQQFAVHSWRDVLENTMNTIAELEPERFEEIVKAFPRLIGWDQNQFRAIRSLQNGAFIEVNLSAQAIQRFCIQAIESIDLTSEDWKVEAS